MPNGSQELIACASYTHARRHPMVLGRIAGWTPPFQLTITQIVVLLATFAVLTWSWSAWAQRLPGTVSLMVTTGLPMALAWAVRRVRVEGRSLPRAALGYVLVWCAPTAGTAGGRPYRPARPVHTSTGRLWLLGGQE
ncbi:MAG: hypothetical protein KY447_11940 [Actinobacteria bacterium]|nr:hypothetical protein [Actinomycetota bacterium]